MARDVVEVPVHFDATGRVDLARGADDLDRLGREADQAARRLDRDLARGADRAGSRLGKLSGAIKGLVAAEALRQLAVYTQRLFDLGTAAEETASKFNTVFGSSAGALDARLDELGERAGITTTKIRELAATTGSVVQGMGYGQEASAEFSYQILELAADLASFNNVQGGAAEVAGALTSALTGEREQLKTLGIVVSEEEVQQKQAARAAEGHADALTQQGKAAATLELITEKAGVAVGDLERTQDSTANTARRLTREIQQQEERFAQLNTVTFRYVLGALADLIRQNDEGARSFADRLARGVLVAVGTFVQAVQKAVDLGRALLGLNRAIGDLVGADGGFSLLALQVNSTLGLLTSIEKRTLQVTRGIRLMQKAWADFRGDPKRVMELQVEIDGLTKAIGDANVALNRFGRTVGPGSNFFIPDASFGFMKDALAEFDAFAAGLGKGGDGEGAASGADAFAGSVERAGGAASDAAAEVRRAREEVDRAVRAFFQAGGALDGLGFGPEERLRDLQLRQAEAREGAKAAAAEGIGALRDVEAAVAEVAGSTSAVAVASARVFGEAMANAASAVTGVFQQAGAEGGAFFQVYKGVAIAQAGVDTYKAANAAYAALAGIPVVGPALGAAAAGAAIAAGLVNVNRIRAMQPGNGPGSGAGISAVSRAGNNADRQGRESAAAASVVVGGGLSAGYGASARSQTAPPQPVNVAVDNRLTAQVLEVKHDAGTLTLLVENEQARQARRYGRP